MTHECPSAVIESLVRECVRLLRPGGVLAIADNNPRSKVIQVSAPRTGFFKLVCKNKSRQNLELRQQPLWLGALLGAAPACGGCGGRKPRAHLDALPAPCPHPALQNLPPVLFTLMKRCALPRGAVEQGWRAPASERRLAVPCPALGRSVPRRLPQPELSLHRSTEPLSDEHCQHNPSTLSATCQPRPLLSSSMQRSTEPHSDEYYQHDIEADMRREGLVGVNTVESDPRHRVVLGYLPADAQQ